MKKELRPVHDVVACDICGRTILKGERTEAFLAPGGQREAVCELCIGRADQEGWIRESAHGDLPVTGRRGEPRRSLLGRLRQRRAEESAVRAAPEPDHPDDAAGANGAEPPEAAPTPILPPRFRDEGEAGPRDPRHVRAVPTNAQAKVDRALDLFNASDHPRTIAGITRSLGEPWVSAAPRESAPAEVSVVVAWELSWYHYRVDLGDAFDPVTLIGRGEELAELEDTQRDWNALAASDGRLMASVEAEG